MRELNDNKLLDQCCCIKEMMARVVKAPVYQETDYAKYPWKCTPTLSLEEVERFEEKAVPKVSEQLSREMSVKEWEVLYGREGYMSRGTRLPLSGPDCRNASKFLL